MSKNFFLSLLLFGIGCGMGWFSHENQPLYLAVFVWITVPLTFYWGLSSVGRAYFFLWGAFGYYFAQYSWLATLKTPNEVGVIQGFGWFLVIAIALWKMGQLFCAVRLSQMTVDKTPKALMAFIALFVLFEWMQQWLFCGENFYPLSSILLRHPIFYPLFACFGVYGTTLLFLSATLIPLFFPKRKESYAACLLLLTPLFAARFNETPTQIPKEIRLALYQTNFTPFQAAEEQELKEKQAFLTLLKTIQKEEIDCLVFSETRLPGRYLDDNPYLDLLKTLSKERDMDIVIGYEHIKEDGVLHNAAALIHQGELVGRYDKNRLMSLMEARWDFLPESFLEMIGAGNFVAGDEKTVLQGKFRYGVHICYDDYFGSDQWKWRQQNLDLILSLHNDVWIDAETFKWNHFQQSVVRSLEIGVPIARVANGGIAGTISPKGKVDAAFVGEGVQIFNLSLEKTQPLYPIFQERVLLAYLCFSLVIWGLQKWLMRAKRREEEVDENAL